MATTITGILKPFGTPIANAVIKVTSLSNDGTIKGVYLTRCTNDNGEYNFHLENGVYSLEYRQLKVMVPVGNVYISDNTPPVLTLEELMNTSSLVPVPELPTTDADWDALLNEHNSNAEKSIDINQATSGDAASIDYEEASSTANSFLGRAVDTVSTPIGKSTKQVIEFSKGSNALAKEVDTFTAKEAVMESSKAIYADANYTFDIKSTLHLPDLELVDRFQKVKKLSSYSVKDHERIAFVNSFLEKQRTATTDLTGKVTKLSESRGDSVTDNFVEASVTTSRNIETSYRDSEGVLVNAPRILEETSTLVDGGSNHSKITQGYEQRITKDDESLTRWYQKVTTYLREGLDEITNNGFTSLRKFIYDKLQFGDVLFVDNVKKEVKVQGKLIIENREDFTGDTIFEVFQYSVDGVTLWHDIFAIEDRWRRHNTSVNGYIDPSKWSAPYLLQAEDGHEGDTLYIQYRYSANMVNWHATFVDGDIWRQERIIENGYPITEWSTPARIIGADGVPGDTVTIEYQYSIDGLEPWHNNFSTGDHYRRERLITNGVAGAWSQPAKLVPEKDVDYTDGKDGKDGINGAKSIILHLYKRGDTAGSMVSTVCTYNFTTKTLTGFNNGWSPTVPSGNGAIWLTVATASSIGETDTVAANEWATPIKFSDGGKGVAGVVNEYGLSASAMTEPANWTTSVPSATKAMPYLWNREIVTYSDGASVTTPSAIIGMFSEDGRGITSVTEYYLASASSSGVTTATTGWTTTIQNTSATKRFLWNYEVIAYTDGTTSTTVPVIIGTQGVDGNGVAGIVNYYLISDLNSGVTVGTAGWTTSVPIPTKAKPYLWNYEKVTYSNGAIDNTPPALIGTYSEDGVSITGVIEYYQVGASSSVPPANQASWPTTAPLTTPTNKYLWNYEKITYSNGTSTSTAPVVVGVHGEKGDTGVSVSEVINYYAKYNSPVTYPVIGTAAWTTTVPTVDSVNKYLWNYEEIRFSSGNPTTTPPAVIGVFGEKGIKSIAEFYLLSNVATGITNTAGNWVTTPQVTTPSNRYLWNYELITYTDNSTYKTNAVVIGVHGESGVGVQEVVNEYGLSNNTTQEPASWGTTVPVVSANQRYLWNREKITYTNSTVITTVAAIIGTYSEDGVSITGITEYYQINNSGSTPPANLSSWPTVPMVTTPTNRYLWNYEKISYSNSTTTTTAPVVIGVHGEKGETGVGITSVVNEYGLSASAGTEPSTWTAPVPTATKVLPYLWNREIVTYTNGNTVTTPAAIIGMFAEDGKGIASVTEYYLASSLSTGVTTATAGWTTAIQHTTVTNRFLWNYEVTTYTDGSTTTTAPVVIGTQGINGVGVSSIVNYYLISAAGSGVTTGTAGWTQTVQTPTKASRYLWNYEKVTYTNGTVENTQPAIIGTYSENGVSITGVTEYYQVGTSGSVAPANPASWPTLAPLTSPTNKYLWNYEKISYSDGTTTSTTPVVVGIHGEKGDTGVGITSVVNEYGLSNSPVTQPASWSTSVVTPTSAQRYLWNREKISYTDSTVVTTSAAIIGMYSEDGKGIVSITEWYLVTNNTTPPANDDARWTTTLQIPTETNRYLWNKEVIKYTVGADTVTPPVIIGIHGTNGIDGYNAATLFIYQRAANQPALPTANVVYTFGSGVMTGLNNGWSPTIPAGTGTIWVSTATALSQSATDTIAPTEWAVPVVLAQSGEAGKHGAGSYIVVVANLASVPNDLGKDNHILQLAGRPAQAGDMITYTSPTGAADADKFVKQFIRGASTWEAFVFAVDGSAVINGTLAAQALKAESAIVDKLYISDALAQNEMTLSGKGDYRLWAGGADPLTAMFSLDRFGNIIAKNGTFKGRIEATSGTFTGAVNATSGTFTGVVNATSGNFTGKVNVGAGYIQNGTGTAKFLATNNGNFYVDHNGKVYAKGGIYGGARIVAQGEKVLSEATTLIAFPSQFSELYRKDVAISPSGQQGEGEYYTDRDGMIFSTGFTSLMHHTNNRQYIVAVSIGGTWTYYISQQLNAKAGILATVVPMLKMDGNSYYYDAEIFIHCKIVGFYMSAKTSLSTVRWKLIELLTNPEEMV